MNLLSINFLYISMRIFLLCLSATSTTGMLNGEEVTIEQIPFQGSVEAIGTHQCSGAILSPKYALITATCAETFKEEVGIATLLFGTNTRLYGGEGHKCREVIQHPNFNSTNDEEMDYDVAIAEIYPELRFDDVTMKAIALPSAVPVIGASGRLSGWGSIKSGGSIMVYARATGVTISDLAACTSAFADVFPVTDRMICAGSPDGVTCDGDNASLLVIDDVIVGLSSWGYGCGRSGFPDVYVNVANSEIRDFIRNVTGL